MKEIDTLTLTQQSGLKPSPHSFCQAVNGQSFQHGDLSLYYEILGGGEGAPLVILNGGPGVDHTYMHCSDVWDRLAQRRRVLFYDPAAPADPRGWRRSRLAAFVSSSRTWQRY